MATKAKTLIIVESPSKGKTIQSYLGDSYIVLASKGHITELAKGGKHGIGIDVKNNFKPHYVLMSDKIDLMDEIINAAKKVEKIIIFSDPDREGESIAWHIAKRLEGIDKPIKRGIINTITKKDILKAIQSPKDIDENLFHAQEARRILDRIVGFSASPFLMNFFGNNLSAGRVQSVVTRMIIDREREIESFVPEDFWTIQVQLENNKGSFATKLVNKITDQKTADRIKKDLSTTDFIISSVIADEEKKYPPPPLVTSMLQRVMSRVHGFDADRTMKAAQTLYESGFCSYLRTDSVRISDDALKEVRDWLDNNSFSIPKKPNIYKNKEAAQDAHECIRPTDVSQLPTDNLGFVNNDEKLVYEMIWRYFVASQMNPAVYNTLKVTAQAQNNSTLEVRASGKALKTNGYLDVFGTSDDSKIDIPMLQIGDVVKLSGSDPVKVEKKQTQPPPRYSVDKLIKELENKEIGRPATYADLLSKISSRNYVEKKGNVFHATELGKKITDVLSDHFSFMNYTYTADLEKILDDIALGKVKHLDMLKGFYPSFKAELDKAYLDLGGHICDKCGSPMISKESKRGKFLGCSAYPKCYNSKTIEV